MQKASDPRISEPMFIRASRASLQSSPLLEHPLDENIEYETFVWKKNPTFIDWLFYIPLNLQHYLKNLSKAFGWKFVFIVCVVYGLQQGLGNAWFFQARDYYFKDYMDLEPAEAQANTAAAHTPWNIKPLYGMASDTLFIDGLQRTPFIVLAGAIGSTALLILSSFATIALPIVVILFFGVNFSVSSPDVMIDASIAEKCKQYPKFASDLQALCWGAYALFSVLGFGTSGIMIQYCGPRLTFGILVFTSILVLTAGSLGFLGEKRKENNISSNPLHSNLLANIVDHSNSNNNSVDNENNHNNHNNHNYDDNNNNITTNGFKSTISNNSNSINKSSRKFIEWNWSNYREHKKIFLLAIFISLAACSLSIVVLATKNWTIRFSSVLFVALSVSFAVYFVNKKDLPNVANVALFIFLREALSPDIETTMFYWYTDADDGPNFSPIYIGVINMIGYFTMFLGVAIYNKYMTTWRYRYIFTMTQILVCIVGLLDIIIVSRWNTLIGYPDAAMLIGDLTLYPMVRRFVMMPMFVLASKVCPDGAEATLYAMLMSLSNFGNTVAIYNGSFLVVLFGVTEDDYDNFVWVVVTKSLCRLLPILFIPFLIPEGSPQDDEDENENENHEDERDTEDVPEGSHDETSNPVVDEKLYALPDTLNDKLSQISPSNSRRSFEIRPRRRHNRSSLNVY